MHHPFADLIDLKIEAKRAGHSVLSLTLAPQRDSSILNTLSGRIAALEEQPLGRILVRLDTGGVPLLARITHKSLDHLGLSAGSRVYAQIKSVALLD